jgi:hypothetical protein
MDQFKEQVVFELEKETPFQGKREFTFYIYRKYGFKPTSALYRDIVNYQICNYGRTFNVTKIRDYIPKFSSKNIKRRIRVRENNKDQFDLEKMVERNDILHNREA